MFYRGERLSATLHVRRTVSMSGSPGLGVGRLSLTHAQSRPKSKAKRKARVCYTIYQILFVLPQGGTWLKKKNTLQNSCKGQPCSCWAAQVDCSRRFFIQMYVEEYPPAVFHNQPSLDDLWPDGLPG